MSIIGTFVFNEVINVQDANIRKKKKKKKDEKKNWEKNINGFPILVRKV